MTKKDKVTVDDIIGIVHTDEPTDSVEEVCKLRGRENKTEKRFTKQEVYDGINRYRINESNFIVEILDDGIPMHYSTIVNRLNEQHKTITRLEKENEQLKKDCTVLIYHNQEYRKENEQLKQSVNNLKDTIVTIGIAYQRKYDRTLVDLVDEVHDEDITDLIKVLKE